MAPRTKKTSRVATIARRAVAAATALTLGAAVVALPAQAADTIDIAGCEVVLNPTSSKNTQCPNRDLTGADFSGLDLSYANLNGAHLAGANFSGAILDHASIYNPKSTLGMNLSGTSMRDVWTGFWDLTASEFSPTTVEGTTFYYVDLTGHDLRGQNLAGASFGSHTIMDRADLRGADVTGTSLAASMRGANLAGMDLSVTSSMQYADLTGADLTGANLAGVNLANSDIVDADARDARFDGAIIYQGDFSGTDLTGASMCGLSNQLNWASPSRPPSYNDATTRPDPPSFATHPQDQAVALNAIAEFTVDTSCATNPRVTWERSFDDGITWHSYNPAGATGTRLQVQAAHSNIDALFRARFTENLLGRTTTVYSNPARLTTAPDIAHVTASFGMERGDESTILPLPGVKVELWTGDASGPGDPISETWAKATTTDDGTASFSVPGTAPGGPNHNTQLWVVPTAPEGYSLIDHMLIGPDSSAHRYGAQRTDALVGGETYPVPAPGSSHAVSSGMWAMTADNPERAPQCGVDAALVVDLSASVEWNGGVSDLKDAAHSFVDALTGTPSTVALYSFDRYAPAAGGTTVPATAVTSQAGTARLKNAIDSLELGDDTNWDSALSQVANSGQEHDLVLVLTDGAPTVSVNSAGTVEGDGAWPNVRSIERAAHSANLLKTTGAQVVAVGVGDGLQGDPANLQAISGPVSGVDYFQTSDYAAAGEALYQLAVADCLSTVSVTQRVLPADTDDLDQAEPVAGYDFTATPTAATVTDSHITTGSTGAASFGVNLVTAGQFDDVTITPGERADVKHVTVDGKNAVCTLNDSENTALEVTNRPGGGFVVEVGDSAPVTCTVYAQLLPEDEPGDPTDPGAEDPTPEPTEPGGDPTPEPTPEPEPTDEPTTPGDDDTTEPEDPTTPDTPGDEPTDEPTTPGSSEPTPEPTEPGGDPAPEPTPSDDPTDPGAEEPTPDTPGDEPTDEPTNPGGSEPTPEPTQPGGDPTPEPEDPTSPPTGDTPGDPSAPSAPGEPDVPGDDSSTTLEKLEDTGAPVAAAALLAMALICGGVVLVWRRQTA